MTRVPALCGGLLGVLTACSGSDPAADSAPRIDLPDVVLITLDTTRADRLGSYGYDKAHTETLDALAVAGRRYDRAYSPLPLTIPAHAAMFTGNYPPRLGLRSNGAGELREEAVTLAEILHDAGYQTGASVAAFVTQASWGFGQGFDAYFDDIPDSAANFWHAERPAEAVVDDALGWLAGTSPDAPRFLWAHVYDPHFPFLPPEAYLLETEGRPYDAELAYVDDQIARIVAAFEGRDTVFVIAGDHGEGLGEHHELTHGLQVYDATQRVPLIISGAGIDPAVIEQPVSLVDLLPSLLDVLGMPVPEGIDGRPVPGSEPRPLYIESYQASERFGLAPSVGVVHGPWKLIDTPRPELYQLITDPSEVKDVSVDNPEEVVALQAALEAFSFGPPTEDERVRAHPSVEMQLQALGYVEGSMDIDWDGPLDDPKDHVELLRRTQRADRHLLLQEREEGAAVLKELIGEYPEIVEFKVRLGMAYLKEGMDDEAWAVLDDAYERAPDNVQLLSAYGVSLTRQGKFGEAAGIFAQLAEIMPYAPRVRSMAVAAWKQAGEPVKGMELGLSWLETYPDDTSLAGVIGVMLLEGGHFEAGLGALKVAILAEQPERGVAFYLGAAALGEGRSDDALRLFEQEVENNPKHVQAGQALLKMYAQMARWPELEQEALRQLELRPADGSLWHRLTLARFNQERFVTAREACDSGLAIDPSNPQLMLMDANLMVKEGRGAEGALRFEAAKERLPAWQAEKKDELEALMKQLNEARPAPAP